MTEKHAVVPTARRCRRRWLAEHEPDRALAARLAALREAQEPHEIRRELRAAGLL